MTYFFCCIWESAYCFTAMCASTVLLCGIKPYWFLFSNLLVCTWWLILFIRSFSSSLPPVFIKLMGRYLRTSLIPSLPGFTIGCIIDLFHCCGKWPLCRHSLYTSVKNEGKLQETGIIISLVRTSTPGAFRESNLSNAACTSRCVKWISSVVCIGSVIKSLTRLWWAPSLDAESSGMKWSISWSRVLWISAVCLLLFASRVDRVSAPRTFPVAYRYTEFHGLEPCVCGVCACVCMCVWCVYVCVLCVYVCVVCV